MPILSNLLHKSLLLAGSLALFTSASYAIPLPFSATITDVQVGSTYNYTIALNNPSGQSFGTFWFAWVPGDGFLSAQPTNVGQPAGWNQGVVIGGPGAYDIRWESTGTPGSSVTDTTDLFTFSSTELPSDFLGSTTFKSVTYPDLTSYIYGGNNATASPLIQTFVVTNGLTIAPTPEPGSLVLAFTGIAALAGTIRARRTRGTL